MDVKFTRGTGYAVARRAVSLDLPRRLRCSACACAPTFRPIISSSSRWTRPADNVWWFVRRDFEYPREWKTISTRKRQIRFAWGPAGGGEPGTWRSSRSRSLPGKGARARCGWTTSRSSRCRRIPRCPGSWRAACQDRPRARRPTPWTAACAPPGGAPPATHSPRSRSISAGRGSSARLDLRWGATAMSDYVVELSLDRATWMSADTVLGGNGGRDPLYLPESEARYLRVRALGWTSRRWSCARPSFSRLSGPRRPRRTSPTWRSDASRGTYPRPYVGEQCAVDGGVGPDAGREEALLSEDGMVETGRAGARSSRSCGWTES